MKMYKPKVFLTKQDSYAVAYFTNYGTKNQEIHRVEFDTLKEAKKFIS